MTDRTAIDTIKGYFYQFDFTILRLLKLVKDSETITVEGIEDLDIKSATEYTAIQCKYYSNSEYFHSVISKPIRQMLNHFKEVKNGTKEKMNYKLYGHFQSGHDKLNLPIDVDFLKKHFLSYKKKGVKHNHEVDLGLTNNELKEFLSVLTIDINAEDYQSQLSNIFTLLKTQYNCNIFEAEHFYYNNALKVIKTLAVEKIPIKRQINKRDFLDKINFKNILFNEWFVEYKGENRLFADLRTKYFSNLNTSSFERFFIIDVPSLGYLRSDLKELIFTISKKWSKLSKREPNPFCPYLYLHNISPDELLEIKNELFNEDFIFIDGFDFAGSSFSPKSLIKRADFNNKIKIKILNMMSYIDLSISEIKKTKEIYQFYTNTPIYISSNPSLKLVNIQISKLTDIKKII